MLLTYCPLKVIYLKQYTSCLNHDVMCEGMRAMLQSQADLSAMLKQASIMHDITMCSLSFLEHQ